MDKDKLNEAAITYAKKNTTALNPFGRIIDDFKAGADWFMSQPLSESLTEEEKEKIMSLYKWTTECPDDNEEAAITQTVLENIFGKDLFK